MISISSDSTGIGAEGSSTIGGGRRALGVVSLGEGAVNVNVGGWIVVLTGGGAGAADSVLTFLTLGYEQRLS